MGKVLKHDVHLTRKVKDEWETTVLTAGSTVPKRLQKLVTNPKAYVDGEPVEVTDDTSDPRADLVAELKKRELPTTGKVEELRERLAEFDAEQGAPEDPDEGDSDESEEE